jgi:hypothetical protein
MSAAAEPTVPLVIRDRPEDLQAVRDHARRCGMSAGDVYRCGARLMLQLSDADFLRLAVMQMARDHNVGDA